MSKMLKRTVDLSIIVPVYNLEEFITPLINSLKAQDLGEYTTEYIFVLNNCTDRSEEVIKKSGIECIITNCDKQGCGLARNVGFDIAKGEYIWFMDGDDWLLSAYALHDAIRAIKGSGLDIVRIPFESKTFRMHYYSMVWQYIVRKSFVEEFRFTGRQPQEDDEWTIKVLNKAGYSPQTYLRMPYYKTPLYFYNHGREGSNMYRYQHGEDINGEI